VDRVGGIGLLSASVTSVQASEFVVRVGERVHTVRVEGERTLVDGEPLVVVATPDGRTMVRAEEGHAQRCVTLDGQAHAASASLGGVATAIELRTAQAAALAEALAGSRSGSAAGSQLKAPMPGRVVRVLVAVGQTVERGAPVVIVEAMKMENEMHAPASGVVLKVHVAEGATVDAGQMLIELELA
jgi:glutaconyl-CoA/methylmalonyl-CoA decarboxylase subunit gamma